MTNISDAQAAVDFGAHAVGFVFDPESPRFISPTAARQIRAHLPPFVTTVGVLTAGGEEEIENIIEVSGVDLIQFHGLFSSDLIKKFSDCAIQVVRVQDNDTLGKTPTLGARGVLLDTYDANLYGGSGRSFNWQIAVEAKGRWDNIILAGGLTPDNIHQAITAVHPYGVDVSSGVEKEKGIKDWDRMKRFIQIVKGFDVAS